MWTPRLLGLVMAVHLLPFAGIMQQEIYAIIVLSPFFFRKCHHGHFIDYE